jgi:hypothetical protein
MPNIQKNHILSLVVAVLSVLALWFLLFPVTGVIARYISNSIGVKDLGGYVIVDAVVSFVVLFAFFLLVLFIKKSHAAFVVLFCAVSLFLYWGFESEFFWKGLNPMYPAWYEINMALNDIVAAILAILLHKRITSRSTGRAQTTARAG